MGFLGRVIGGRFMIEVVLINEIMDPRSNSLHACLHILRRSAKIPKVIGAEVELCEV